jgi:hypothetical protein
MAHKSGKVVHQVEQLYRPGFPDSRAIVAMKALLWMTHRNLSQATE